MTADYPNEPGSKDLDTSRLAAEQIATQAPLLRRRCLTALRARAAGATADEIAADLGLSILSVRPRFSELRQQGLILDTGVRRANESGCSAKVWRAA
jgi:predicted ArsR family transcriptional regulator